MHGFRRVTNTTNLTGDRASTGAHRALEVAVPAVLPSGSGGLPPLNPNALPFFVGVELTEVPIPPSLVEAVLERAKR